MSTKAKSDGSTQVISGHIASKFPILSQNRAVIVAITAIVVGGLAFAVYMGGWPSPSTPSKPAPPQSPSSLSADHGGTVSTGGNTVAPSAGRDNYGPFVGGNYTVNTSPMKTKSDLRITGMQMRDDSLYISVRNDGPDTVKSIKGTLVADAAPPPSSSKLTTKAKEAPPGTTIELGTAARAKVWYPMELQVWSDDNEDPTDENNQIFFDRNSGNMLFIPNHSGKVSWSESELNAKRKH